MKTIKYKLLASEENTGGKAEKLFLNKTLGWNEINERIAKEEAYNGEYTIEDDGLPDPVSVPTQLDSIEAQVAYTAMMTNTLLEV